MRERRVQFIISEKESETRILNQGLPQEGVLSPILYAIYTKDIRKKIDEDITVLQFADDVVLYNTRKGKEKGKTSFTTRRRNKGIRKGTK